jgi:hypothetical protein
MQLLKHPVPIYVECDETGQVDKEAAVDVGDAVVLHGQVLQGRGKHVDGQTLQAIPVQEHASQARQPSELQANILQKATKTDIEITGNSQKFFNV